MLPSSVCRFDDVLLFCTKAEVYAAVVEIMMLLKAERTPLFSTGSLGLNSFCLKRMQNFLLVYFENVHAELWQVHNKRALSELGSVPAIERPPISLSIQLSVRQCPNINEQNCTAVCSFQQFSSATAVCNSQSCLESSLPWSQQTMSYAQSSNSKCLSHVSCLTLLSSRTDHLTLVQR